MKKYLEQFNLFSKEEIDEFFQLCTIKNYKKNDFFIKQGEVCDNLSFVKYGTFRSFYYSNLDEQITYCFAFQNSLLVAYSSFISETKSKENIQAMNDAEIISIRKCDLDDLARKNKNWLEFLKIIAEQEYVTLENWILNHQRDKAQNRYLDLIRKNPEYVQEIPLQHIASYLGITQRHLSRIRAKIVI